MARFWRKISPYWHIFTTVIGLIVAAVLWVGQVQGSLAQTETNTARLDKQEKILIRLDYNVQQIADQVGARLVKRGGNE